jgi:hypothetical protein
VVAPNESFNNISSRHRLELFITTTMRLSGLQKEVLALYRQCLRACREKPEASRKNFRAFARYGKSGNLLATSS